MKFSSIMKAHSRYKSNRHRAITRIVLIALVLIAVFFILRPPVLFVAETLQVASVRMGDWLFRSTGSIPAYFRDRNDLVERINTLESTIAGQSGSSLVIQNLVEENTELRAQLSVGTTSRFLARVIARPPQLPFDALQIDRGFKHNVREGAVVYAPGDVPIGLVVRVFDDTSLVQLNTSAGVESTVFVVGPDIYTYAVGQGGGVMRVEVPQGIYLEVGNLVVVPALGEGIYGAIESISSVPTEPVQYAYVTIGTPLRSLRTVTVADALPDVVPFVEAEEHVRQMLLKQRTVAVPIDYQLASSTATSTATSTTATTTP